MSDRGAARRAADEVRWPQLAAGRYPSLPYLVLSALLLLISASAASFFFVPRVDSDTAFLDAIPAFILLAMAVGVWFLAPRVPNGWGLDIAVVLASGSTIAAAAFARSAELQATVGLSIVLFGVYAAYFRPTRRFVGELVIMVVAYGLCVLRLQPLLHPLYFVVIVVVGTAVAATVAVLVTQLRDQAVTDQLTGALNRRGLHSMGAYVHAEALRSGSSVTVGLVDIDNFKSYNDQHGHIAGDELLSHVARTLRRSLRGTDVVARFGGDEFALIMPGTDSRQAAAVLRRVAQRTDKASWSVGWADWHPSESLESALASADEQLYRVKHAR